MRYSNSQLDTYNTCPKMFFYKYIDKIRSNQLKSSLLFGTAIDDALEELVLNKNIEKSKDVFIGSMQEWKNEHVHYLKKDLDYNTLSKVDIESLNQIKDPVIHEQSYGWHSLFNKGLILLDRFNDEFLSRIDKVLGTQLKIEIVNGDNTIIGYIDMLAIVDGVVTVIDFKTSGKSYSMRTLENSQQLHLYYFAICRMIERGDIEIDIPTHIAYCVLRKDFNTKGLPRPIDYKTISPNQDIIDQVMNMFDTMIVNVDNKVFNKTDKTFTCKNHFGKPCDYREICIDGKSYKDLDYLTKKED